MPYARTFTLSLPLLALVAAAPQAHADLWPVFDHIKISPSGIPPVIEVTSQDGKTWSKIKPSPLNLGAAIDVKVDKGELVDIWTKHGGKTIVFEGEYAPGTKSTKAEVNIASHTGNLAIASMMAVNACNAKLKTGNEIHSDQWAGISDDVTIIAKANRGSKDLTRDSTGSFPITVKCLGVPKPGPDQGVAEDLTAAFGVKSASLAVKKPKSNACPAKAELTARFGTNMEGKVTFIYRKAGGGKSAPITVNARKTSGGKFAAIHKQVVDISEATDTKYMVEVVGKGIISEWKPLVVPCKIGLGGGGDMVQPPAAPMKVLSAQLGIQGPKTKLCPAKARVTVWLKTNKAGKVGFRMVKKGGPVGAMMFATAVKGPSGYIATYSKELAIHQPLDTAYSVIAEGGAQSNFVPLKASCAVKLPGGFKPGA